MIDKKLIEDMIQQELKEANKAHPMFHSDHEAYAVLAEEVEEACEDMTHITSNMDILWKNVKNDLCTSKNYIEIHKSAVHMIQEAIQVASMAEKALASIEWRRSGK